ncbi:hypothetical protein [Paracoccus sp. S3-43]|nr:hypothetical protein [Paracoccus sp. S3-43]WEF24756.1 hypothetical protein PXD02_02010 [Paracoccus sp. S3-43]
MSSLPWNRRPTGFPPPSNPGKLMVDQAAGAIERAVIGPGAQSQC